MPYQLYEEQIAKEHSKQLEETNNRVQSKLESYQELFDSNQRLISLGKKLDTLAKQYLNNKKKKPLMEELFKLVLVENSKIKKTVPKSKEIKKVQKVKQQVIKQKLT